MKIRTEMMSLMAAGAFVCFGVFAAEPAKPAIPAKNDDVPDCCKPDFLKSPVANTTTKPAEATAPAMGGCKKGGMGGCGGHGGKEGGCGGHGAMSGGHGGQMVTKSACDSSTITLVLPCGHDIKVMVGGDNKSGMMGGCGGHGAMGVPKMGGCGGHGGKEGGCGGHGAMGAPKMGGCGGHGGKEGGCGGHAGCQKNTPKPAEYPAPAAAPAPAPAAK